MVGLGGAEELRVSVLDFGAMMSVGPGAVSPLSACSETSFQGCPEERASSRVCIISAMSVSDLP